MCVNLNEIVADPKKSIPPELQFNVSQLAIGEHDHKLQTMNKVAETKRDDMLTSVRYLPESADAIKHIEELKSLLKFQLHSF